MKSPLSLLLLTLSLCLPFQLQAQERIAIPAPEGWRGETIPLPPPFARDMTFQGVEEIRFAPGMFDATSENFFSYVIVFRLEGEPEITADLLASELLAYFRGLSRTTAPEKEKFEVQLKATAQSPEGANTFEGTARWIETFRTQDWQTLQIEARSWKDADAKTWVFLSISPQEDKDAAIWKEMSGIRDRFLEQD